MNRDDLSLARVVLVNGFECNGYERNSAYHYVIVTRLCHSTECDLKLQRRTRDAVRSKLRQYKYDYDVASDIVDKNNNLFGLYRRNLFTDYIAYSPYEECAFDNTLLFGNLLLGKVFISPKSLNSLHLLEMITGRTYTASSLEKLWKISNRATVPFLTKRETFAGGQYYQIANVGDAWDFYLSRFDDPNLIKEMMERFLSILPKLFFENRYQQYSNDDDFRYDILDSLCYLSSSSSESLPTRAAQLLLGKLQRDKENKKHALLSRYLQQIAMIDCESVYDLLQHEIQRSSPDLKKGFVCLFKKGDTNYPSVLWTFNVLMCFEHLKEKVGPLLFQLFCLSEDELTYSNKPIDSLTWLYMGYEQNSYLSIEEKIQHIDGFFNVNRMKAMELLKALQYEEQATWMVDSAPRKLNVRFQKYDGNDQRRLLNAYASLFIKHLENASDVDYFIGKTILYYGNPNLYSEFADKVSKLLTHFDDNEKRIIYDSLTSKVYRSRFYGGWHQTNHHEDDLLVLRNSIVFDNELFKYLYFFAPSYSTPILNPTSFNENHAENDIIAEREFCDAVQTICHNRWDLSPVWAEAQKEDPAFNYARFFLLLEQYFGNSYYNDVFQRFGASEMIARQFSFYIVKTNKAIEDCKALFDYFESQQAPIWFAALLQRIQVDISQNSTKDFFSEHKRIIEQYYFSKLSWFCVEANEGTLCFYLDELTKAGNVRGQLQIISTACESQIGGKDWLLRSLRDIDAGNESIGSEDFYNIYSFMFKECSDEIVSDPLLLALMAKVELRFSEWLGSNNQYYFLSLYLTNNKETLVEIIEKRFSPGFVAHIGRFIASEDELSAFSFRYRFFPVFQNDASRRFSEWMDNIKTMFSNAVYSHRLAATVFSNSTRKSGGLPPQFVCDYFEPLLLDKDLRLEVWCEIENHVGFHTVDGRSLLALSHEFESLGKMATQAYPNISKLYFDIAADYKKQSEHELKYLR